MADRDVVSRAGKGAALNIADHDQNLNAYLSTSEEQTGATYEVVYTDHGKLIELNNASMVCTLDAIADIVAAMDSGVDNFSVTLKNTNAADATVNRSSTDTIDGLSSIVLATNQSITLQTNAADDVWLIKNKHIGIYHGWVNAAIPGSSVLPAGWTVARASLGRFTVTHNLGTAANANSPILQLRDGSTDVFVVMLQVAGPDFFIYESRWSSTLALADVDTYFILAG